MTRSRGFALVLIATLVAGLLRATPAAAFTGAISGTVTDGVGNGLICQVNAWQSGGVAASIVSNADGTYTIGGLADGTYAVSVATGGPQCSGFADEYWNNKPDGPSSDPVVVSGGATTTNIDVALGDGTKGAIRGHVTNTTGAPLNGCVVDAIDTSTGAVTWWSQTVLSLRPDGTYFITPLTPGSYKVRFRACTDGAFYGSEFYADRADLASADPITVFAGVNSVGIDGTLATSTPGGVSGTVTDGAGNGLACQVNFWDELNTFVGSVFSSTVDGTYLKNDLPSGTYRVQVVTGLPTCSSLFSSEWYQDRALAGTADPVNVTAGATTTNIDVALGDGTTGAIRGRVTSLSGTPLNGCVVDAVNAATGGVTTSQTSLISRPDGAYTLTPLVAGAYKVRFRACTDGSSFYGGEFYSDRADLATADAVTVAGGASTSGIDGRLAIATPGAISGIVSDAAGAFHVCQINFWDELFALAGSRFSSASDGTYLFDNAAPGTYRVQVNACDSYPSEWYEDQTSFASATAVSVTTGATRAGVNITLGTPTPPPTVTSLSPTSGATAGGTAVTISGTGFVAGSTVTIGGTAATGVVVLSANVIIATTPSSLAGAVDVVVTTANGSVSCTACFRYLAPAPVTSALAMAPAATVYGSSSVALSATLTGGTTPISGRTISFSVATTPGGTTLASAGSAVTDASGVASVTYALGGRHADSYSTQAIFPGDSDVLASTATSSLTVAPAPLTITADNKTKVYGAALPALTVSFSGFVNGDTAASLTVPPTLTTTATLASHVAGNPYAISASGAVAPDYAISYVAGSLSVTKADQTITFGALADKIFGEAPFTVAATASSGLPGTFTASGSCTVSGSTVALTAIGRCTITASQPGNTDINAAPNVPRTFDVLSPVQFAHNVIAAISGMGLPSGTSTSLTSKLQAYLASIARGNQTAACGQLGAFINHVKAESGKHIPAADAALLLEEAARLRAVLRCN